MHLYSAKAAILYTNTISMAYMVSDFVNLLNEEVGGIGQSGL